MAIGRISGSVLKSNLTRNGVDLAFETNLLYLDVTNSRVGIGTSEPSTALQVSGTVTATAFAGDGSNLTSVGFGDLTANGSTIISPSNADITLDPAGTGVVKITSNILPDTTETYDIGSTSLRFNDIYLAGSTVDIGGTQLTKDSNGDIEIKDHSNNRKRVIASEVHIGHGNNKVKLTRGANGKLKQTDASDIDLPILTVVGDDSTGTDFNSGEDLKIAGAGGITTAMSGDTLTITGPSGTMSNLTDDTTPQLGGNLDLNSSNITGTGNISTTGTLSLTNTTTGNSLLITTTEDSSTAAPVIALKRNSSSPAPADYMGQIKFLGENDADQEVVYAKITGKILDESDGTEDGIIEFANRKAGSNVITARLRSDSLQLLNSTNLNVAGTTELTGNVSASADLTVNGSIFADKILPPASNNDLVLEGSGTGTVSINSIKFPTSDGSADQFLKTDGSGQLSFGTVSTTSISQGNTNVTVADTGTGSITVTADANTIGVFNTTLALNLSSTTNAISLPKGTTSQRPSGATGLLRFNTSTDKYEGYTTADGWFNLDGSSGSDGGGVADSGSSATGIGLNASNIDTFTTATYDSAWYYAVVNDEVNGQKSTQKISLVHDNTYSYVATSHMISTDPTNDYLAISTDIDSSTVRLRGTGSTDTNSISFYRVPLGDNTTNTTSGAIKNFILEDTTNTITEVNTYTHTGESTAIDSTTKNLDNFTGTAFDSAWYLTVHRDETNSDVKMSKYATAHNGSSSFVNESGVVANDDSNAFTLVDADFTASKFRLRGTATSAVNSMSYYRIALGDNTSAETSGAITTAVNADVDSAAETIDSWAKGSYRGAKYYVSAKNSDSSEVVTSEATVVHDGTTAYISQYNSISTTNDIPMTLTADISGSNVVVQAAFTSTNWKVTLHRTLLADSQSNTNDGSTSTQGYTLANATVSSTATEIDSFSSSTTTGAFYIVTGYSSGETAASIAEVSVLTDGSGVFTATSGVVSTKSTDQLTFSATISSGTISVKAASTSGASTTVSAYKVQMLRGDAGLATIDTFTGGTTNRAAKYYFSVNDTITNKLTNTEALVVHDGTTAYITQYGTNNTSADDLITLSAEYDSGTVKVKAISGTARVTGYRILLQDDQTASSTDDTAIIAETTGVSSTATEIDTWETDAVTGAFYVVAGYNSSEGTASASEVMVVTGGTSPYNDDVFIGAGPTISTKGTDQLEFSATLSGTTVSVKAASTSGSSTNVSAYRVNMLRGDAGASAENVTVADAQTISGDKTFSSAIALQVVGSAPSTVANKAHIYAKDVNVSPSVDRAEIFVKDEQGNETRISPHNEQGDWEYFSRNIKTGKTVRVNMEEMIRDIEKLTGKKYIKEE